MLKTFLKIQFKIKNFFFLLFLQEILNWRKILFIYLFTKKIKFIVYY